MKRIKVVLVSYLFCVQALFAQITLNNSDMPVANDTIRYSVVTNFAGIAPKPTGANHTWDFSGLQYSSQTVDTFVSILSTGLYAFQFPTSSFAIKSNTPPVSLGTIAVNYDYDFYKKSTSAYMLSGLGANVSGLPIGIPYTVLDTIYRFPLDYGNTGTCTSNFGVTVPTLGHYSGVKTRIDTVDGWGTLITPYGTFSVLRVKSIINETDSVFVTQFGLGLKFALPQRTEYRWLANGKKTPLLQITVTGTAISDVLYQDSLKNVPTSISVNNLENTWFSIYPNPAKEIITIRFNLIQKENVIIAAYTLEGKQVAEYLYKSLSKGAHELALPLSESTFASGTYFIKVMLGDVELTQPLIISR